MTTLISDPTIGRLCQRTRKWAHDYIAAPLVPLPEARAGLLYADLGAVEAFVGSKFSDEQLAAAAARADKPARLFTIPPMPEPAPEEAA